MSESLDQRPSASPSTLPGAAILLRARRLLFWALGAGIVYGFLMVGSKSYCPGGFTGDGGYVDGEGQPTDVAPQCLSLTLQPSFVVYLAIAIIVVVAFTWALKRAGSEAAAIRTLDRAVVVVIAVAGASILIGHIGFWMTPVTEWDGISTFWFPYPLGIVGADSSPMPGG